MIKMNPKEYIEKVGTWSVFEEENVEIKKWLDAEKKRKEGQKRDPNKVYPFLENTETEKQIVDQNHQYWAAVCNRLISACHEYGCSEHFGLVKPILYSLPNVDVEGTLDFYRKNGGYCDCLVLYYVYGDANEQ